MGRQPAELDLVREEPARAAANEKPMLGHRRFLTRQVYAWRIRTLLVVTFVVAVVAVASGCDSSDTRAEQPPANGSTTTTTATTATDALEGAGTTIVVATSTAKTTGLLERVAVGQHEGFDRVVFQFRGEGLPGYRIQYVEPPLVEDGS